MTDAYPLRWPDGWPRTPTWRREDGKYRFRRAGRFGERPFWTFADARDSLFDELRKLGAEEGRTVLSSNFPLNTRGLASDRGRRPEDEGVAVYFMLGGKAMVMAQDRYIRAEENMRSLALAIEAMRQLDRHGGGAMMERAFSGFQALPPAEQTHKPWWQVLGVSPYATTADINAAWRAKAKTAHPDVGGTAAAMMALNAARDIGLADARANGR